MELHSYPRSMKDILILKRKYVIPRFQREYSWGEEELSVLWEDILDNISFLNGKTTTKDYFVGALVLVGNDAKDTIFQVVDGQQRLTTITVIFSVLTDIFKSLGKTGLMNGTYSYIVGKNDDDEPYHILENENPKPYFQLKVQDLNKNSDIQPSTDEEIRIKFAYDFYKQKLSRESLIKEFSNRFSKEKIEYEEMLKTIRQQILDFKTIYITVASLDDAYLIFETLNAKGKDLESIDLVKNKLFQILKDEKPFDSTKEKWNLVKRNLYSREQKVNISTFFRHFWLSKYAFTTESKLYESFLKKIKPEKDNFNELLDDLLRLSSIYTSVINPHDSDWKQQEEKFVIESLEALRIFNISQVNTLLLTLIDLRKRNEIALKNFKKCIEALESFHFIFTAVTSSRASGLESKYSLYSRKLLAAKTKKDRHAHIDDLIKELREKRPSFAEFSSKFEGLYYTKAYTKDKKLIQYILKKIEQYYQKTDELKINIISIEHILSESTDQKCVGKIGNLLPLDKKINSDMKDVAYIAKLKYLSDSQLQSVINFLKENGKKADWTENDIEERTKELSKLAYDSVWKF